ncbi:MAG: sterol desaturase family protein [Rugosibacter sp.]
MQKLLYVLPALILIGMIEALVIQHVRHQAYAWRESFASLGVAAGQRLINTALAGLIFGGFLWVWDYRVFTVPMNTWSGIALLVLGLEFFYYWQHRLSHTCRWFWATHAVHHSPNHLYLSSAFRLGWTGTISGNSLFFIPLVLLGFHPTAVFAALGINLLYQFWLHTELVPRLGWFDVIFNSPSNHRVHHSTNPQYLDTNYGGILMIFDHLFGTYAREEINDPCHYGLVQPMLSNNPLVIALREWAHILRDLKHSHSLHDIGGYLCGPPGWKPDGSGMTTSALKHANRIEEAARWLHEIESKQKTFLIPAPSRPLQPIPAQISSARSST